MLDEERKWLTVLVMRRETELTVFLMRRESQLCCE